MSLNTIVRQLDLHNTTTRGDAVYHVAIINTPSGFAVATAHGARGAALRPAFTAQGLSYGAAEAEFSKIARSKMKKGYDESPGISGPNVFSSLAASAAIPAASASARRPAAAPPTPPPPARWEGIGPMLLNDIQDVPESYLSSEEWGAQEKMDGERRMASVAVTTDCEQVIGINKLRGLTPLPENIRVSLLELGHSVHIDGEIIGDTLYCFDLIAKNGCTLADKTFLTRYNQLAKLLDGKTGKGLELVRLATTTEEKRALYASIKAAGGEGVVFKKLRSPYVENRPNRGGDAIKCKFKASASCIVIGGRQGKRSVEVGLLEGINVVSVGNVTVPANHEIPAAGEIVEIEYLYVKFKGGNLFQPVYKGVRSDITREECVISQVQYKGVGISLDEAA